MPETYYRLHANPDAPEFSSENAYSGLWGSEYTPDGSKHHCYRCTGSGTIDNQDCPRCGGASYPNSDDAGCPRCDGDGTLYNAECADCDGTGWYDADPGYSCCHTAQDLVAYMTDHGTPADDDPVVIFEGEQVGTGFDGEPLVIPTKVIRWTTYGELRRSEVAA